MTTPVAIALVDDQDLVREGIKALLALSGKVQVRFEANDGEHLLAAWPVPGIEVVVMDVRMPGRDGLSTLADLRRRGEPVPVLILTTFDDNGLFDRAVACGAQGFLRKDARPEDLVTAIQTLRDGGTVLMPEVIDASRLTYPDSDLEPITMSEREIAILRLMAGGYGNREIAQAVFLAEGTVKNYVSEILAKLEARDRTQAVLKAISRRLI